MIRFVAALSVLLLCGCEQPTQEPAKPPLATLVPITIGKAYATRAGARVPVMAENLTGETLRYLKVTCALFDDQDVLIESVMTNWTAVPIGGRVSGELLPETMSAARMECVPST